MKIIETEDFRKDLENLPQEIKRLYKKQKAIFKNNWFDPRLHIKRLKELPGVYSFRITRRYRVLFISEMKTLFSLKLVIEKIFTIK